MFGQLNPFHHGSAADASADAPVDASVDAPVDAPAGDDDRQTSFSFTSYMAYTDGGTLRGTVSSWLAEQGLTVPPVFKGGGGGALVTVGRLVVDGYGAGIGTTRPATESAAAVGAGEGGVSVGVLLFQNRFLRVYPLIGGGGAGGGIGAGQGERPTPPPFWLALVARGGLGIDVTLRLWVIRVLVGLRIGVQSDALSVQVGGGTAAQPAPGRFVRVIGGVRFGR